MAQQFANPQVKIRTAILLFLKSAPQPLVLYSANPLKDYEELKNAMKTPNVIYEKDFTGPIKKVCVVTNNILGVLLQEEQYA